MRQFVLCLVCFGLLAGNDSHSASATTFDFESPAFPAGAFYGNLAGDSPGSLVFTQSGVNVFVDNFSSGAFTTFGDAFVNGPPSAFFPPSVNSTQSLSIGNLVFVFDFSGLPFDVNRVQFDYSDLGGVENIDVNFLGRQEVALLSNAVSYPNYFINATEIPNAAGVHGTVEITAAPGFSIQSLSIGGQEFAIDNLVVVPEPSSGLAVAVVAGCIGLRRRRQK